MFESAYHIIQMKGSNFPRIKVSKEEQQYKHQKTDEEGNFSVTVLPQYTSYRYLTNYQQPAGPAPRTPIFLPGQRWINSRKTYFQTK